MAPGIEKPEHDANATTTTTTGEGDDVEKRDLGAENQRNNSDNNINEDLNKTFMPESTTEESIRPVFENVAPSRRQKLLGRFSIIPEATDLHSYGNVTKWWMTIIVSFASTTSST